MTDNNLDIGSDMSAAGFGLVFSSDSLLLESLELMHKEVYLPAFIETFGLEQIGGLVRETWLFLAVESRERGNHPLKILLQTCKELKSRKELKNLGGMLDTLLPSSDRLEALVLRLGVDTRKDIDKLMEALCNREQFDILTAGTENDEELELITDLELVVLWFKNCRFRGKIWLGPRSISREAEGFLKRLKTDSWFRSRIESTCVHTLGSLMEGSGPQYQTYFDQLVAPVLNGHIGLEARKQKKLMIIGDSPRDCQLAQELGACFFPLLPGRFRECWLKLETEAWPRFLSGNFTEVYQTRLIQELHACFPLLSPWETEALKRVS